MGGRLTLLFGLPAVLLVVDQFTKYLIVQKMHLLQSITLIPGVLDITSVRNRGAAFGIMAHASEQARSWVLVGVSALAVVLLTVFFLKTRPREKLARVSAALVIGGAIGNLIDRVRVGEVVDFIDIHAGPYHWPAFNIADSAITIGICLFLWASWRDRHVETGEAHEPTTGTEPLSDQPKEPERVK